MNLESLALKDRFDIALFSLIVSLPRGRLAMIKLVSVRTHCAAQAESDSCASTPPAESSSPRLSTACKWLPRCCTYCLPAATSGPASQPPLGTPPRCDPDSRQCPSARECCPSASPPTASCRTASLKPWLLCLMFPYPHDASASYSCFSLSE